MLHYRATQGFARRVGNPLGCAQRALHHDRADLAYHLSYLLASASLHEFQQAC